MRADYAIEDAEDIFSDVVIALMQNGGLTNHREIREGFAQFCHDIVNLMNNWSVKEAQDFMFDVYGIQLNENGEKI